MINILYALQVMMIVAWAIPLVLFRRFAWRKSTGPADTLRAAVWFVALSVVAFPARWLIFGVRIDHMPPVELAIWSALYVLAGVAAAFLTLAAYDVSRGR